MSTIDLTDKVNELVEQACKDLGIGKAEFKARIVVDDQKYLTPQEKQYVIREELRGFIQKVCKDRGIDEQDFYANTKTHLRKYVTPRQLAMVYLWYGSDLSLSEIGEMVGEKDHATVLHAKKTINNLRDTSRAFKDEFTQEYEPLIIRLAEKVQPRRMTKPSVV